MTRRSAIVTAPGLILAMALQAEPRVKGHAPRSWTRVAAGMGRQKMPVGNT
jgi:hypothetical protein